MGHHHHHHHHHGHEHHDHSQGIKNLRLAFFLNLIFTLFEVFGGFYTNSVVILSDALHDLGDSLALGLAWYFQSISTKEQDKHFTFGYKRFSLLGALINSLILVGGSVAILSEAIPRLIHPEPSHAKGMIFFAIVGVLVNGFAALRVRKGNTMNERVVSLHLLEDVLGWVVVLIASIVILLTDFYLIDPILSIIITLYILYNAFKNLRESMKIFLQGSPKGLDQNALSEKIKLVEGVKDLHQFHVWTLDGSYNIVSVHLVLEKEEDLTTALGIKNSVRKILQAEKIEHITIELETTGSLCDGD